jgi:peptidyl-prolyl cis-trans isomerase SurA
MNFLKNIKSNTLTINEGERVRFISLIKIPVLIIVSAFMLRGEVLDKIIAVVGDEIILKSEVDQFVEHQRYSGGSKLDDSAFRERVLEELILGKIVYDIAVRDTTINVSDEEVQKVLDSRINSIIAQIGSEKKLEEMYNTTVSDLKKLYRSDIRKNLYSEKLKNKRIQKVIVSRKDVEDFFETYGDSLPPVKASVVLSQILIGFNNDAVTRSKGLSIAENIRKSIIDGEITFEEAALKYSEDKTSAARGGSIGLTSRGDLVPEYEMAAFNLKPGEISGPVVSKFGYHLIKMNEKSGEKINTSHILITLSKAAGNDDPAYGFALTVRDSIMSKKMSFEEAVRKYSSDEKTKYLDGSIGSMEIDELDSRYSELFKSSPVGFVTEPMLEKDGYFIYKIVDKREAHKIELTSDYSILKNMALERKKQKELSAWVQDLKKNVHIEIK